jgi:hypothetical protein
MNARLNARSLVHLAALAVLGNLATASAGMAHEAGDTPSSSAATPNPAALVQLESVRRATARFLDEQAAITAGYVDISVFYPNMGHHYLKPELLDERFEPEKPELLVYADDPCSGSRRLVAVEYAVPLALADRAPAGFVGSDDNWTINQQFQLWTLHAWLFEYNPAGVLAAYNPRVP